MEKFHSRLQDPFSLVLFGQTKFTNERKFDLVFHISYASLFQFARLLRFTFLRPILRSRRIAFFRERKFACRDHGSLSDRQRISNFSISKSFGCTPDAVPFHPRRSDLRRHSANSSWRSRRAEAWKVRSTKKTEGGSIVLAFPLTTTATNRSTGFRPRALFPFKTIITCEKFPCYGCLAERNRNCRRSWLKVICTNFPGWSFL